MTGLIIVVVALAILAPTAGIGLFRRGRRLTAWLTVLGLGLGAVAGLVIGFLLALHTLPRCVPQGPSNPCDAPGYVAIGLALLVGTPVGAALGTWGGRRLARRLTKRCS